MKIKNIAAICKRNKCVTVFDRYGRDGSLTQYIGDGGALYPVTGLPELDGESVLTIFDVPEKDREKYIVQERDVPPGINFEDIDPSEKVVEGRTIAIVCSGRVLKPLQTSKGLVFIESRYLSPMSDVMDVLELYERTTSAGQPYIVAKAGLLLQAVIMPFDVINQQFVDQMRELTRMCGLALDIKRAAGAASATMQPEQYSMDVDPATGEVVKGEADT